MRKIKNKRIRTMVILLIVVVVVGGLLVAALLGPTFSSDWKGRQFELLVRSETMYIILIMAAMLLIFVLYMIRLVKKRNREIGDMPNILYDMALEALEKRERMLRRRRNKMMPPKPAAPRRAGGVPCETAEEPQEIAPRFYMLNETDERMQSYAKPIYDEEIGFEELCLRFRQFCAGNMKLYYDIADIRRFVASLTVTHLIVMQGMSGTGKTSLAYAFGEFLQNQSVIVPIQPMWKERTDMIGYYNEFTRRFNETTLLQKMYEANYNDEIYVTVLDEMNIARVEYYFAEFLSLLEIPDPDKRYLDVVSDKWENDPKLLKNGQLRLPTNMWFMGTVNNDDSTFAISDKVYDRAMVMNLDNKSVAFEAEPTSPIKISARRWDQLTAQAREEYAITDRNLRRIQKLDEYLVENFRITFGNRIMKQIKGYVPVCIACGGRELDAIDDILSKKVLRKLESQNPVYVKSMAESLCNYLDELFGNDGMPLCKEYLRRLERNA